MTQDVLLIVGITLLCMLSPGPDMVLVMHATLRGDRRQGLATSAGVLTGNLVHITYCALGVGYVVAHSVVACSVLKLVGGLYLIFLGLTGLRSATRPTDRDAAAAPPSRARSAYLRGLANNLLNPKGALFYLGVFSQVIRPDTPRLHALLLIAAMVGTSALFWLLLVASLHLAPVRRWLARSRRAVDGIFGALLVMLGLRVATQE